MYANEDVPIEKVIVDMMADHNWTLSAAESCTGGLVAETLTSIPERVHVPWRDHLLYQPDQGEACAYPACAA